jgi:hypothetical protein
MTIPSVTPQISSTLASNKKYRSIRLIDPSPQSSASQSRGQLSIL